MSFHYATNHPFPILHLIQCPDFTIVHCYIVHDSLDRIHNYTLHKHEIFADIHVQVQNCTNVHCTLYMYQGCRLRLGSFWLDSDTVSKPTKSESGRHLKIYPTLFIFYCTIDYVLEQLFQKSLSSAYVASQLTRTSSAYLVSNRVFVH